VNARKVPPWIWILGAFLLLRIMSDDGPDLLPLLVVGLVAYMVLGRRLGRSRASAARPPDPVQRPAEEGPMRTIDVPRFPGAPEEPADPWGPPVGPSLPGAPSGPRGMSSLGSDPAVSLAQLQVAQTGRDLEQAAATRDGERVDQALRRLLSTVEQVQGSLAGSGSPGAARVRAALDGLRGSAEEALRVGPGAARGALLERIAWGCRSVGQTGPL
jgi:hypothetical protein